MNRIDFMNQLERLLQDVSPTEREEALQYYNDYFDDAGAENEKEVIEALGNPARVAENIKRDLQESGETRARASDRALVEYDNAAGGARSQSQSQKSGGNKKDMPTWAIVLLVVLLIFASPVLLGVGSGIIGVLIGFLASWFAVIFGFGVVAVALFAVMFVLLIVGLMCIPIDALVGVGLIGGGLLCGGIGILFLMLTVAMSGVATPAICKGIAGLFRKKRVGEKEN